MKTDIIIKISSQSYSQESLLFNRAKMFQEIWNSCIKINCENYFHKVQTFRMLMMLIGNPTVNLKKKSALAIKI